MDNNPTSDKVKALIVYYSRSGNTRAIARMIQELTGGDLVELATVDPYPAEYEAVTKQAKKELQSGYLPPLKTRVEDLENYGIIFVGSPNWWSTIAPPVITFLSAYDLSGKTVAPFITHGGGGLARCGADVAALCPASNVQEPLALWGGRDNGTRDDVAEWLGKLGMVQ